LFLDDPHAMEIHKKDMKKRDMWRSRSEEEGEGEGGWGRWRTERMKQIINGFTLWQYCHVINCIS
jgi:hypothetical protein